MTIIPAHNQSHRGKDSNGRSFQAQHPTKQMSAKLSSNAPVLVAHLNLRVKKPSMMSLKPQRQ